MDNLKKIVSGPKIVFVILGVILLVELVYVVRTLVLTTPPPSAQKTNIQSSLVHSSVAKISLKTPKTSFTVNEVIPVSVMVDTAAQTTSGVDLIIHYDPKILEASSAGLVKGKIFDEYPLVSVDISKGVISISGVSSLNKSFNGEGQFAQISLKAKASGKTSLTIDFKKGSTTASNIVESSSSKNIIEAVDNLELNIQ